MSSDLPELHPSGPVAAPAPMFFRNMDTFTFAEPVQEEAVVEPNLPDPQQLAAEAKEAGFREGVARMEQQMQQRLEQERQTVAKTVEAFFQEKQKYFAGLEREVVHLSLAIAERVLHREAAMDPTLLAGAARVALEQMSEGTEATLRVAPEELEIWSRSMANEADVLKVTPDPSLQKGECLLETTTGTLELGVKAQLQEIERGFFELLGRKPSL